MLGYASRVNKNWQNRVIHGNEVKIGQLHTLTLWRVVKEAHRKGRTHCLAHKSHKLRNHYLLTNR